jgi:NitT/TauT family transport system permease protein
MKNRKVLFLRITFLIIILCVWQALGVISKNFFFALSTPCDIIFEFFDLIWNHKFYKDFLITGAEAVSGLIIGTFLGSFFGLILWYSRRATEVVRPFIVAFGTLPLFAFAPLFILWFGIGFMMKVSVAAFSTIFISFSQANRGAFEVSTDYLDALMGLNATKKKIFRKVVVPASINWVFNSMRLNVGFGLLGAFIGEYISSDVGLGRVMLKAAGVYNVSRAFAAAIGVTILALLLDYVARKIEKHNKEIVQWISVPKLLRYWDPTMMVLSMKDKASRILSRIAKK